MGGGGGGASVLSSTREIALDWILTANAAMTLNRAPGLELLGLPKTLEMTGSRLLAKK